MERRKGVYEQPTPQRLMERSFQRGRCVEAASLRRLAEYFGLFAFTPTWNLCIDAPQHQRGRVLDRQSTSKEDSY